MGIVLKLDSYFPDFTVYIYVHPNKGNFQLFQNFRFLSFDSNIFQELFISSSLSKQQKGRYNTQP